MLPASSTLTPGPLRHARRARIALLALGSVLLAGCDLLGIEGASAVATRREAEGKAIGGACRHAARSIEQCYETNKKADKAAVYAGWREMNDYMRENKLEPQPASPPAAPSESDADEAGAQAAGKAPKVAGKASAAKAAGSAKPN